MKELKKYRVTLERGLTGWGYDRTREFVIALPEGLTPEDVVERLEAAYDESNDWTEDLASWDVDCADMATSDEVHPDTVAEFTFDEKGEVVAQNRLESDGQAEEGCPANNTDDIHNPKEDDGAVCG